MTTPTPSHCLEQCTGSPAERSISRELPPAPLSQPGCRAVLGAGFVEWYNGEHRHSGIKYVKPNQRYFAEANEICAVRQQTYDKAYQENPRRWSRLSRCWKQPEVVKINHPRPEI